MTKGKMFNLIDEPWIRVMDDSGRVLDVGILECFQRAHELKSLAGELPTQDVTMLRFLLAILYAVFGRVDASGKRVELADSEKALEYWRTLWERKYFAADALETYLRYYEERFWLFHPERPFYQVPAIQGTSYPAEKLMGDISESNNKPRFFSMRSGLKKNQLEYGEAARWLLYLNAFDDTSSKPSQQGKGKASVGPGWLGRLGLVYAEGKNLFETILLNWTLFEPFSREIYSFSEKTCWEEDDLRDEERVKISIPGNPLSLLTLQTRRITLERDEQCNVVIRFSLVHGDGFDLDNAFIENMTIWRYSKKDNVYRPRKFDPAMQLWRDFQPLTALKSAEGEQCRPPGVIAWLSLLAHDNIIPWNEMTTIKSAGAEYDEKFFYIKDIFSDSISINKFIFRNLEKNEWLSVLYGLIERTDSAINLFGELAEDIFMASGGTNRSDEKSKKKRKVVADSARRDMYFSIDLPFRNWLSGIKPDDDKDAKGIEWLNTLRKSLFEQSKTLHGNLDNKAVAGISKFNERMNQVDHCNTFTAFSKFYARLKEIIPETGGGK